jgi:hypothetical protein
MKQQSVPSCSHPTRGGQEHILGMGTGDYHCGTCHEPMPIMKQPEKCIDCGAPGSSMAPDPEHGRSWHCSDCGKNWGWVS